jgi:hypothetical protein
MGYDTLTEPSLCDGRGQLAPFKKIWSQAQLEALQQDKKLKEKKYGLGYQVCRTSAKLVDATMASPQMEDGNQPTIDELEEIDIGTPDIIAQFLLASTCPKKIRKNTITFFQLTRTCLLGLMKKCLI